MVRHLLTGARITSTALRDFGVLRSIFCTTTEGFPSIIFQCILKRWSTDSITGKRTYSNASSTSILVTFPTNYLLISYLPITDLTIHSLALRFSSHLVGICSSSLIYL